MLPKGLFLRNTIAVCEKELLLETDYFREAQNMKKFSAFIKNSDLFCVPQVYQDLSTGKVLVTEKISGLPVDKIQHFSRKSKNQVKTISKDRKRFTRAIII